MSTKPDQAHLAVRWRKQRPGAGPVMVAALVLLGAYDVMILRHPVLTRIRDLGVPMAVVGGWIGWEVMRASMAASRRSWTARAARAGVFACVVLVVAAAFGSVWNLTSAASQIGETRVLQGWAQMRRRAAGVVDSARAWPWEEFWPVGELPEVIRYVGHCTAPSDHLLVTWPAPEYYVFARRPFAAGHVLFRSFTSPRDQSLMLSRLQRQDVPVALINETQRGSFADDYAAVDAYLRDHYTPVADYLARDGSQIVVAVRRDLRATSRYGVEGWPCGFVK